MYSALKVLIKEQWICPSDDKNDSDYIFNHTLLHETIYDLTPSSDRNSLHKSIAEYYENLHADDPQFFGDLSHHFAYCNPSKAFEYAVKKADYCIEEEGDMERCCMVLNESLKFVQTVVDTQVIMVILDKVREFFDEVDDGLRPQAPVARSPSKSSPVTSHSTRKHASRAIVLDDSNGVHSERISPAESVAPPPPAAAIPTFEVSKSRKSFFSCCCVLTNNVIQPGDTQSIVRSQRSGRSGRSSSSSRFSEKGLTAVYRIIRRIDRRVLLLQQSFTQSKSRPARILPWQIVFLQTKAGNMVSKKSTSSLTWSQTSFHFARKPQPE
jgi:hypothetical protein